jgi:hypothetical protein
VCSPPEDEVLGVSALTALAFIAGVLLWPATGIVILVFDRWFRRGRR